LEIQKFFSFRCFERYGRVKILLSAPKI
jgi:hypothetical protein